MDLSAVRVNIFTQKEFKLWREGGIYMYWWNPSHYAAIGLRKLMVAWG
jgi:hypothetical protein